MGKTNLVRFACDVCNAETFKAQGDPQGWVTFEISIGRPEDMATSTKVICPNCIKEVLLRTVGPEQKSSPLSNP